MAYNSAPILSPFTHTVFSQPRWPVSRSHVMLTVCDSFSFGFAGRPEKLIRAFSGDRLDRHSGNRKRDARKLFWTKQIRYRNLSGRSSSTFLPFATPPDTSTHRSNNGRINKRTREWQRYLFTAIGVYRSERNLTDASGRNYIIETYRLCCTPPNS